MPSLSNNIDTSFEGTNNPSVVVSRDSSISAMSNSQCWSNQAAMPYLPYCSAEMYPAALMSQQHTLTNNGNALPPPHNNNEYHAFQAYESFQRTNNNNNSINPIMPIFRDAEHHGISQARNPPLQATAWVPMQQNNIPSQQPECRTAVNASPDNDDDYPLLQTFMSSPLSCVPPSPGEGGGKNQDSSNDDDRKRNHDQSPLPFDCISYIGGGLGDISEVSGASHQRVSQFASYNAVHSGIDQSGGAMYSRNIEQPYYSSYSKQLDHPNRPDTSLSMTKLVSSISCDTESSQIAATSRKRCHNSEKDELTCTKNSNATEGDSSRSKSSSLPSRNKAVKRSRHRKKGLDSDEEYYSMLYQDEIAQTEAKIRKIAAVEVALLRRVSNLRTEREKLEEEYKKMVEERDTAKEADDHNTACALPLNDRVTTLERLSQHRLSM